MVIGSVFMITTIKGWIPMWPSLIGVVFLFVLWVIAYRYATNNDPRRDDD